MATMHNFFIEKDKNQYMYRNINGNVITFQIRYNDITKCFNYNIYKNNKPLICGGTITTGFSLAINDFPGYNLFEQYGYLNIGELYVWQTTKDLVTPTYDNLHNFMFSWVY